VVFYHIYHFPESGLPSTIDLVQDYVLRLWYFGSLSGIILALSYAADVRDREERIGRLQALAHSAQIRALRNQLNPHFLFNALNSISGLISAKRVPDAEIMTEDLADFLRLTLALDPQRMITLDQELHLQRLYLSIEKVRFPDRLHVEENVPDALRTALVPSLITQPLIENSIKYAVARSTRRVELRVSARASGEVLEITVSDSGGDAVAGRSKGARLGLTNVAERVHMHYGEEGHFIAEPEPSGGFRNVIRIPLQVEA
jgi:LytS/YehU family sensor histidine kinase